MGQALVSFGIFKAWFGEDYPWNYDEEKHSNVKEWSLTMRWLVSISNIGALSMKSIIPRIGLSKTLREETQVYLNLRGALEKALTLVDMDSFLYKASNDVIQVLAKQEKYKRAVTEYLEARRNVQTSIDGKALLQMGVKEGPLVGEILERLRHAWLKGQLHNAEEENALLRQLVDSL